VAAETLQQYKARYPELLGAGQRTVKDYWSMSPSQRCSPLNDTVSWNQSTYRFCSTGAILHKVTATKDAIKASATSMSTALF